MAAIFDASSYFTKRQSDLRYMQGPLTSQEITAALGAGSNGNPSNYIPGGMIAPATIQASSMASGAMALALSLGGLSAVTIIPPSTANTLLASSISLAGNPYVPGSVVYWTPTDGTTLGTTSSLYTATQNKTGASITINFPFTTSTPTIVPVNGFYWSNTVPAANITGLLTTAQLGANIVGTAQLAQNIKPNTVVSSLPTITGNPANYNPGDTITLMVSGQAPVLYQLDNNSQWRIMITQGQTATLSTTALTASWLTAGAISAGAIKASQIDVTSLLVTGNAALTNVLSLTITANVITAASLAVNSVTANSISANAVVAGKIAANAVTAGTIAAGAVSTQNLIVGNWSCLMEDPTFEIEGTTPGSYPNLGFVSYPAGTYPWWEDGLGLKVWAGWGRGGTYGALKAHGSSFSGWPTTSSANMRNRMVFAVKDGDQLYIEGWALQNTNTNASAVAQMDISFFTDQASAQRATSTDGAVTNLVSNTIALEWGVSGTNTVVLVGTGTSQAAGVWCFASNVITVPTNARWAFVSLSVQGQTSGAWAMDDLFVISATPSAYITSLNAAVINTGTLAADRIGAGTLNCTNLYVSNINGHAGPFNLTGGIPGSTITSQSITNTQIANATITSAQIANATITNAQIANATITSAQIANAAITSANIASLNASVINSGTLTVGGNVSANAPGYILALDISNNPVAWMGVYGGYSGLWAQNAYIGGASAAVAPIVGSAAGVHITGASIVNTSSDSHGTYTVNIDSVNGIKLTNTSDGSYNQQQSWGMMGYTIHGPSDQYSPAFTPCNYLLSGATLQLQVSDASAVASLSIYQTQVARHPVESRGTLSLSSSTTGNTLLLNPDWIAVNGSNAFTGSFLDQGGTSHSVVNGLIMN